MRIFFLVSAFVLAGMSLRAADISPDVAPLKRWIARQADVRTLSADFVQTRRLRVLRDPVARPGRLWFQAPGSFRWELGAPPETIALRRDGTVFLISVKARKVARQDPSAIAAKTGMRDAPMMEFPLATNYADFARRFQVLAVRVDGTRCDADIMPREAPAQKFLRNIRLSFDTATGDLLAFEISSRDGSSLRSEFSNVQVNRRIPPATFDFDLTGYTVTRAND